MIFTDLFVANATHFYFFSEVGRFLGAADCPKQSDRASHRCLYNRKSVKNDCASNCLAFTYKNRAREKRTGVIREEIITVNKSNLKLSCFGL